MSIFLFGSIASWALTGVSILVDYHRPREGMKRVRGARIRAKCSWNIFVLTIDTAMGCISWGDGMSGCLAPLHSSGKFCRNIHGLNVSCALTGGIPPANMQLECIRLCTFDLHFRYVKHETELFYLHSVHSVCTEVFSDQWRKIFFVIHVKYFPINGANLYSVAL